MRLLFPAAGSAALLALAACGGQVSTAGSGGHTSGTTSSSSSSGSTSSSTSSTSSSGTSTHGDCQTDADCSGKTCAPLTPGGYKVCLSFPPEATMCQVMGPPNQCCTSADCASQGGGGCYSAMELQFCGGAQPLYNECIADKCQTDVDCGKVYPPQACIPAGAFDFPKRACFTAFCHTDADCTASPGGACLLVGSNPCCSHPAPSGLGCVYSGGLHKDADCPNGSCTLNLGKGVSVCGPPHGPCPP